MNELYINIGGGRFHESAHALGADDPAGAGLGVTVCDFDEDGWPDIFVANDGTPNALLHNKKGHFESIGMVSGVAYGEGGEMRAGMGTIAGDYNADGHFDLLVTNFQHEPTSLFRNALKMAFTDESYSSGIGTPSLNQLKFGVIFADLNGDGWPDIYQGNGHVYDNVAAFDDSSAFEQPDQVFINRSGRFVPLTPDLGDYLPVPSVTRGVACGDFNNDGAIDVLVNSVGRPARLLANHLTQPGQWLGLKLEGTTGNRSAIGARVELHDAGVLQVREVRSGGSYLSQSDLRVLFNIAPGVNTTNAWVRISWPGGHVQRWVPPHFNQYHDVRERQ